MNTCLVMLLYLNTLRQAILKGELAPGERLMDIQLAEKLGVSRNNRSVKPSVSWKLEGLVLGDPAKGR